MSRFFMPAPTADAWAEGLAKPEHWRPGFSAHSLAHTWHPAGGFPPAVRTALHGVAGLHGLELPAGLPEHDVALPGGRRASRTDLFVLARNGADDLVAIAVEGKAEEPFGPTVDEWRREASEGKGERLRFLCAELGLDESGIGGVRYQLVHRTASALLEARRFGAGRAVMLVHSFGRAQPAAGFGDFERFASLVGVRASAGHVCGAVDRNGIALHLGWVQDAHPEVAP